MMTMKTMTKELPQEYQEQQRREYEEQQSTELACEELQ
jgi:hypothetical protein